MRVQLDGVERVGPRSMTGFLIFNDAHLAKPLKQGGAEGKSWSILWLDGDRTVVEDERSFYIVHDPALAEFFRLEIILLRFWIDF